MTAAERLTTYLELVKQHVKEPHRKAMIEQAQRLSENPAWQALADNAIRQWREKTK